MRIEIEYKITFDPEDGFTTPITAYDGRIVSVSKDIDTTLKMNDVGERGMTADAKESLSLAISGYFKSLENK